jgi:precorrin-2 dehydrogenase/sirohydrochlorin ferrochelatase
MAEGHTGSSPWGLYPIGLKIAGRRCLVVGSGPTARRKMDELLACGAIVEGVPCAFVPSDLDGASLVVAATDDSRVQAAVAESAAARGIPCNVVDVNHLCTFYAPAVLRRGAMTISIATDGKFPLLAVAVRDRLAGLLDESIGPALELLGEGRELAAAHYPDEPDERVAALRRLLSSRAVEWILDGRLERFEAHWKSWKKDLHSRA